MNTLKLKVVLLCCLFFAVGYGVSNFDTLKAKFCEIKQPSSQTNNAEDNYGTPLFETVGPLRVAGEEYEVSMSTSTGNLIVKPVKR